MPISPKNPSALLRSLGADESALDAKLRVSAREAEQRWPLFRALAPSKADATPPMSDVDKQAWEQTSPPAATTRKPLLTRPGLSSKLSSGLEKFAAAPSNAKKTMAAKDDTPRKQETFVASATRANAKSLELPDAALNPSSGSGLFASPEPKASRTTLFASAVPTPAPVARGLFAGKATPMAAQRANEPLRPNAPIGNNAAVGRDTQPAADDSLADLFARVEGKSPTATPTPKGRMSSVMRRIGKR